MAGQGRKGRAGVAVLVDIICIGAVALPCLILGQIGEPYSRGFFCSDDSIRHPYKESTISTAVLIIVSYLAPSIIFLLVEIALFKSSGGKTWENSCRSFYTTLVVFLFGSAVNQLITDICKYTIGRLRPHFLEVCQPNISFTEEECGTRDQPKYVIDYHCQGNTMFQEAEREQRNKDAHLSFLSGHASLSFYAMCFAAIYIQRRLTNRNYRLIKPLIQVCCLLFAVFTTLSRISDYKHHPEDVIGGALLGISMAVLSQYLVRGREVAGRGVNTATSTTTLLTLPSNRLYSSVDTGLDSRASPTQP